MNPIFPYFGGKRRAAAQVWDALGTVDRYIEPFFGSGAVLLGNPNPCRSELVNDLDSCISNLWRALQHNPEEVWQLATCPISEIDLKARRVWLDKWTPPDFMNPDAYDAKAAGFWLWILCVAINPQMQQLQRNGAPRGIKGRKFTRAWFNAVVARISRVEVLCGDWKRCVGSGATAPVLHKTVGVFLDPPYGVGEASYANDGGIVARDVWEWAMENGDNPRFRIVVAGYDDGRKLPKGWNAIERVETGAYARVGKGNDNRKLERLWLSPHCVTPNYLFQPIGENAAI